MRATNRLALKEWSIVSRYLYEGSGIITFLEEYIPADRELFLFPAYEGQREDALKPGAGMSYRHELPGVLGGPRLHKNLRGGYGLLRDLFHG